MSDGNNASLAPERPEQGGVTPSPPQSASPPVLSPPANASTVPPVDKEQLLSKARAFLASPVAQAQNLNAKRAFLSEKGLSSSEVETLLQQVRPTVPPRMYPQPQPSNLLNYLLGMARILSWIGGASMVLTYIYYRFLLPRISQTVLARHSLRSHHLSLMRKLTTSLSSLKESQAESYAVLPRVDPYRETGAFAGYHSIADVLKQVEEQSLAIQDIPTITLLRCGIEDLGKGKAEDEAKPTTPDLFRYLEGAIPWLTSEEGLSFEQQLWETLSTCPLFTATAAPTPEGEVESRVSQWAYTPHTPQAPTPHMESLGSLVAALPKTPPTEKPFQYAHQALSDFTGYISTQVYLPYRPPIGGMGHTANNASNPAEEEMKREIRALKGLVLNRRSFMPTIPKANSNLNA